MPGAGAVNVQGFLSPEMDELIQDCWQSSPLQRPTFDQVHARGAACIP